MKVVVILEEYASKLNICKEYTSNFLKKIISIDFDNKKTNY
jgi:hypothetical protein